MVQIRRSSFSNCGVRCRVTLICCRNSFAQWSISNGKRCTRPQCCSLAAYTNNLFVSARLELLWCDSESPQCWKSKMRACFSSEDLSRELSPMAKSSRLSHVFSNYWTFKCKTKSWPETTKSKTMWQRLTSGLGTVTSALEACDRSKGPK